MDGAADSSGTEALPAALARLLPRLGGIGVVDRLSSFALVTAGRDQGSYRFERDAMAEHLRCAAAGLAAAGLHEVQVALTPLSDAGTRIAALVTEELSPAPVGIVEDRDRQHGRGYYRDLCFKINARVVGELAELADGGFTDWGMRLTADNKERLLISGLGLDRLALALGP